MPVQLAKRYTTVEEFEKWQAYFVIRRGKVEKWEYYHAATAHAVYRTMGNAQTKLEDHLIKFEQAPKRVLGDEEMKEAFLAIFGVKER